MAEAAKGFQWLFLHPVHTPSTSSRAPVPWIGEEGRKNGRRESLLNLLKRAARDEVLSADPPTAPADATEAGFLRAVPPPSLQFSGCHLVGVGELSLSVPLLMADLVYISASSRSEVVEKEEQYLLALAPRPAVLPSTGDSGDLVPLEDVWMMYTLPVQSSDFLRLLFQFGSRGALRWDLHRCYSLTERALGSGGCGTVYLGQSKMNLPPAKESSSRLDMPAVPQVAIKKLNKSGGIAEETSIRSEIEFLAVAKGHPNITALFGVFCYFENEEVPRMRWCIVMSLYAAGDLFDYLAANGAMPEPAAVTLMLCLLSALTHLHQLGVVHRDVKAENILLDRSKAVLSDLGIAAYIKDEEAMQKRVGSPGYAPPEVVTDLPYDEKVHVFGSGVVLFFALSNTLPFPGKSLKKVLELTARCKVRYNASLFGEYSGSIMQLLKALLQKDPTKRPSAKKSFISLWTLAKPDVRSSSAAKAAFQAVEDGVDRGYRPAPSASASAPNASPTAATGPLGPTPTTSAPMKVVRTSSQQDDQGKVVKPEISDSPKPGAVKEPGISSASDPVHSASMEPRPPSGPKPSSSSFSFWKNRLGWGGKSSSPKPEGDSSQGTR